jgi:paraquat-inducible protein B
MSDMPPGQEGGDLWPPGDTPPEDHGGDPPPIASAGPIQPAEIGTGRHISLVWLIPIVAVLIAGWLGYRFLSQTGPTVTITFLSADGLTAGQTEVRHKAVTLGTVEAINLSPDMSHVIVRVRMRRDAKPALTDQTRFWVVRPRFTPGNISGLETIVSGSYIELDPGDRGGDERTDFTGLETPPAIRSDEPGHTYVLRGSRLGSLTIGSLVFYRDVTVGEILGYDVGKPGDPVTVYAFVRSPYDTYIHDGSYFWNASGISLEAGANGVKLQLQSLQAVFAGGVAFDTPPEALHTPVAASNAEFPLFDDLTTAAGSHYRERVHFLMHVKGSVAGLAVGAPVQLYGIQVGVVTGVQLHIDPPQNDAEVQVRFDLEPERVPRNGPIPAPAEVLAGISNLVEKNGLRGQLRSANFLTGQLLVALDFFPDAGPAQLTVENTENVLPNQPADLENIQKNLADISHKLDQIPFDQIGNNLNRVLQGADRIVNGADLKNSLRDMSATLHQARDLVQKADAGATPALQRLPQISQDLQNTVNRASRLVGSLNDGGAGNSAFGRDLDRLLSQVSEAARSVRLLSDYLDEHPEALIRGRTSQAKER